MPRFSLAYSGFLHRIKEIVALKQLAKRKSLETNGIVHPSLINTLCRAGVVLISSHLEGYIEELGEHALEQIHQKKVAKNKFSKSFRYHLVKRYVKSIRDTTDPEKLSDKIGVFISQWSDIWSTINTFRNALPTDSLIGGFSNPKHKHIRKFFRCFGYNTFDQDLRNQLTYDFDPCCNMIDQIIEQRNKIAHGDTTAPGTPSELEDMIRLVKKYCRNVDIVVGDWFRDLGCPIR